MIGTRALYLNSSLIWRARRAHFCIAAAAAVLATRFAVEGGLRSIASFRKAVPSAFRAGLFLSFIAF